MLSQLYQPTIGGTEQSIRNPCVELASRRHEVAAATTEHDGQPNLKWVREVLFYNKKVGKQLKLR